MNTCTHWTDGAFCGARGGVRKYLTGDRCPNHTPAALRGRPETTPDPALTITGLRTAAGIAVDLVAPLAAGALLDERAVASGRRRSSQHVYTAARAAEEQRKQAHR